MKNSYFEGINLANLSELVNEHGSLESFIKQCDDKRNAWHTVIKKHAADRGDASQKVIDAATAFYDAYDALYHAAKTLEANMPKSDSISLTEKLDKCLDYISEDLLNLDGDTAIMCRGAIKMAILPFMKNENGDKFAVKLEITNGGSSND